MAIECQWGDTNQKWKPESKESDNGIPSKLSRDISPMANKRVVGGAV